MNSPQTVLITGGAGFFGRILTLRLLDKGYHCIIVDLVASDVAHERLTAVQGDIRHMPLMQQLFENHRFCAVFHLAAILAHDRGKQDMLWSSNVDATGLLMELCEKRSVPALIYTSSNCLWAHNFGRLVTEEDVPAPAEIYGRSKWEAERIIQSRTPVKSIIIRCPTIMDSGRLGLLTILFDFIREGKKVWVVGGGRNRYQFIYAQDLADACIKAIDYPQSEVFNIGSDHVAPLRDVYQYVINKAGSQSKVASLPKWPTLAIMRLCHLLGISPLGPYHYKMIAEDFIFDTQKIKSHLNWAPTLINQEMTWQAYRYYTERDGAFSHEASVHSQPAKMGIIRLLKFLS